MDTTAARQVPGEVEKVTERPILIASRPDLREKCAELVNRHPVACLAAAAAIVAFFWFRRRGRA